MGVLKRGAWTPLRTMARFTRKYLLRNLFRNDYWFLVCACCSHSSYGMPTLKALRWHCCSVIYWKHARPNVSLYHNLVNQIVEYMTKWEFGNLKIVQNCLLSWNITRTVFFGIYCHFIGVGRHCSVFLAWYLLKFVTKN